MPLIRSQCIFPTYSGMPEDQVTNTLWFNNLSVNDFESACESIQTMLDDFWQQVYTDIYCGNWLLAKTGWTNHYDWSTPEPRVPFRTNIADQTWNYASTDIPTEVAACMSFHAPPVNGISQARRRGRIFIAGLTDQWLQQSPSASYPTLTTGAINNLNLAAKALQAQAQSILIPWVVYSTVNEAAYEVEAGWVDNSPDTIRRRSVDASVRTTWVPD